LKLLSLDRKSIPKLAVLAAGLTAAVVAGTMTTAPAQALPSYASACTGCHSAGGSVSATAPTANLAPGAAFTVALAFTGGSGNGGYWISGNGVSLTGGPTASSTFTVAMTAPTAAGTYTYTAWMRQGSAASKTFSITVAAAPLAVTTTTALAVTPASPAVAPANPTLTATVTGTGAAGTVQFLNGTTVLGTSTVAAGRATLGMTGVAAGSYSYIANFIPTSAAAFTLSNSSAVAYVVTAPVPVAVTTTTALAVTPASPVVAPAKPTLTATVTGAGAAGSVAFFDGATSLGTSSAVAAGVATKGLTGVVAGTHSYTAVFTPTSAAAFTLSNSSAVAYLVTAPAPNASFNSSVVSGFSPLTVALTDTSTGAPTSWAWNFGNGTTSTVQSPSVTYTAAGTYTVSLIASNASGSSAALTKTITLTAPASTVVTTTTALAMNPTAATDVAPAVKTLNATVTGLNAAGMIEFFDGTTSLGTNSVDAAGIASKVLTGIAAGSYSYHAVFIPTDPALFTSSTSGNLAFTVTATPVVTAPVASFTVATTSLTAALTDTSTNAPTSWLWDLGNGTKSTLQSPSVTYAAAGTYKVTLTATNSAGAPVVSQDITVTAPTGLSTANITSLSRTHGQAGDRVTISGTDFGTSGVVNFGSATARVLSWSTTAIVVRVPSTYSVKVGSKDESEHVWYHHDSTVLVTVTPQGGAVSNAVGFRIDSNSDD
jgi:PKD repeat protein